MGDIAFFRDMRSSRLPKPGPLAHTSICPKVCIRGARSFADRDLRSATVGQRKLLRMGYGPGFSLGF